MSNLKVGDVFATIVTTLGFHPSANCNCASTQEIMNGWGPALCRAHVDALINSIATELNRREIVIPQVAIRETILTACYITEYPQSMLSFFFQKTCSGTPNIPSEDQKTPEPTVAKIEPTSDPVKKNKPTA